MSSVKASKSNILALAGTVSFFVFLGLYLASVNRFKSQSFTTGTEAAAGPQIKGIITLDAKDTALVQCLGLEIRMSDGKLSNNLWTGTKISCVKPQANPLPTVIPTPTPAYTGGYYLYDRYYPTTQTIQYTCQPYPGRAPIKVIKPEWGKTAVLLKCM